MKKIVFKTVRIIIVVSFFIATFSYGIRANDDSDIDRSFLELQNQIGESFVIRDGKYVVSAALITDIVEKSDFDFRALNKKYGTRYTEKSFINKALGYIEEADVSQSFDHQPIICTLRSYCGANFETSGWNYKRYYCDHAATNAWIEDQNYLAYVALTGGVASSLIGGPVGTGLGTGFALTGAYHSSLALALSQNNGYCGTITDINRFTAVFTVSSQ